jgi:hypothetical protein
MSPYFWLALGGVVLLGLIVLLWRAWPASEEQARLILPRQRPELEQEFLRVVSASGKPRGLRWKECDWEPGAEIARDRQTGEIVALVGVTISFEAIEGGDMEGVAAVSNLRNATAIFAFTRGGWRATGRVVFNLNPDEVLQRFASQYERLPTGGPA